MASTPSQTSVRDAFAERGTSKTSKDVLIFIHGITTGFNPDESFETDQIKSYDTMYETVKKVMKGSEKGEEWNNAEVVKVLWGFEGKDAHGNPLRGDHTRLARAERFLGERTDPVEDQNRVLSINPLKWLLRSAKSPLRYGMADMFFYVSRAGRPLIRKAVARQIMNKAVKDLIAKGELIELTFFGHSAGSVVAHDFVFFLHQAQTMPKEDIDKICNTFADDDPDLIKDLHALVQHARDGKLKVRKLFTLGSPLHILFIRSIPVLRQFSDPEPKGVDPATYGFADNYPGSSYPRWINVLDEDDPIAGPVIGAIDENRNQVDGVPVVMDLHLDTTWKISKAHGSYWWSNLFAKKVQELW